MQGKEETLKEAQRRPQLAASLQQGQAQAHWKEKQLPSGALKKPPPYPESSSPVDVTQRKGV